MRPRHWTLKTETRRSTFKTEMRRSKKRIETAVLQFKNTNTWQRVSCGSDPLFSSWYICIACMFTRLKSRDRDRDIISSRPRRDRDVEPSRPRRSVFPNSRDRDETETFNLQDRDETRRSKKTSRDRLETEMFKTETTSLIRSQSLTWHLHLCPIMERTVT